MSELTFLVLRIGFLILLWFFVFAVVYALRTDMFGDRQRKGQPATASAGGGKAPKAPAPAAAAPRPSSAAAPSANKGDKATVHNTSKLVIIAGPRAGDEVPLSREPLTIGRSADSTLILRDDYTSTHHARLLLWNDDWMIQDLDSTNGTFLAGKRVSAPTSIPLGVAVKVGATSFELR